MKEFYRWADYETLEPFGDYWPIQQGALLTACVFNALKGKRGKSIKPDDLLPKRRRTPRKMTDKQIQNSLMTFARMHNAAQKDKR